MHERVQAGKGTAGAWDSVLVMQNRLWWKTEDEERRVVRAGG